MVRIRSWCTHLFLFSFGCYILYSNITAFIKPHPHLAHLKMGNLAHNYLPLLEYPLDNKNESSWVLKNVRPGFMIWNNSKIYSLKIVLISLFEKRRKSAEARRPMMICSHCRANNADDANFCQQCGKRLGTTG